MIKIVDGINILGKFCWERNKSFVKKTTMFQIFKNIFFFHLQIFQKFLLENRVSCFINIVLARYRKLESDSGNFSTLFPFLKCLKEKVHLNIHFRFFIVVSVVNETSTGYQKCDHKKKYKKR